jgi:hypothetical protein
VVVHDSGHGWNFREVRAISVHDCTLDLQDHPRVRFLIEFHPPSIQSFWGNWHSLQDFIFDSHDEGGFFGQSFHLFFVQFFPEGRWQLAVAIDLMVHLKIQGDRKTIGL